MNIGIVVEGEHDRAAYPPIIRKIRGDVGRILAQPCGNDVRLMRQFVGWLKHFQWHAECSVDKALVIRDSDCLDPATWEAKMGDTYEQSRPVPFPVHFYATKCEIESWLLADESAINQVARNRGKQKSSVPEVRMRPPSNQDKELFEKALLTVGLPVTPAVYEAVAAAVRIERIRERCPYFHQFMEIVRAC